MQAKRIGNGWFTDDAEYVVGQTYSGWTVTRGDGCYAEFLGFDEAMEAAEMLATGERDDSDYLWSDR